MSAKNVSLSDLDLDLDLDLEDDDVLCIVEWAGQVDLGTVHVRNKIVTPCNTKDIHKDNDQFDFLGGCMFIF